MEEDSTPACTSIVRHIAAQCSDIVGGQLRFRDVIFIELTIGMD